MKTPEIDIRNLPINKVINGAFDFWQRNNTFSFGTGDVNFTYTVDRWFYNHKTSTGTSTVTREDSTIPNARSAYIKRVEITALDTMATVSNYMFVGHSFEGQFIKDLKSKDVYYNFKVRTNKLGQYTLGVGTTNNEVYTKTFEVTQSGVWEEFFIKVPLDYFNEEGAGLGLQTYIMLASGSDRAEGVDGTWNLATSVNIIADDTNQVNFADTVGNYFEIGEVQFYDASNGKIEFRTSGRNYAEELDLCRRYYQKSYELDTPPNTATDIGMMGITAVDSTAVFGGMGISFSPPMRSVPVMIPISRNGTNFKTTRLANSTDRTGSAEFTSQSRFGVGVVDTGQGSVTGGSRCHFTADAEL